MFDFSSRGDDDDAGSEWISVSDLMAGLMMVFLCVAIFMMSAANKEREKVRKIARSYVENQVAIYDALRKEFEPDLDKWGATIDKETLAFNFQSPDVLFGNGEIDIKPQFQFILDDFFPRYLMVLKPYRDSLDEVRIEGHTSSAWGKDTSDSEAYFNNMQLSQGRTRSVLTYLYVLQPSENDWIKRNFAAVGFSSSRLILDADGHEDADKSRRVSFRAITNAHIQIKRILEAQ